jgi:hypothetical protein
MAAMSVGGRDDDGFGRVVGLRLGKEFVRNLHDGAGDEL